MPSSTFVLSVFADEIAADLQQQLETLQALHIGHMELRSAGDKNVVDFAAADVAAAGRLLARYGVGVACIGSPIGKSPLDTPLDFERGRLQRVLEIAADLEARLIRVFSFYPPAGALPQAVDSFVPESARRLAALAELAGQRDICLVVENEGPVVGNTPARCRALMAAAGSPALRLAWDSANFLLAGVARPVEDGWPQVGPYVQHVHIKDARMPAGQPASAHEGVDNPMCLPGAGQGQIADLLRTLWQGGYRGYLALEPHLKVAGRFGGFSGPDGTAQAVAALRGLLAAQGIRESPQLA